MNILVSIISMYPNKWERRPRSQVVEEKVQLTQLSTTLTTPRLTSPRELQFSLRPAVRPRLPSPISVTARSTGSKVTNFTTDRRLDLVKNNDRWLKHKSPNDQIQALRLWSRPPPPV
ncbi:hypothetical protein ElyMa_005769100 [Elysia marginata]|uniref:Uncharacterized protein n=1 Tax=Elysia marginata TaxID=1093978 RepID=A0AAV4FQX3_9GAST|nr:hypothetical protein ElyMa_005769100 [Elysia marginata]